jgi:hypothetical protein
MLACGTSSPVPGMWTPRGSLAMSLTSCASSCSTTQPASPASIEMRNCSFCSALMSREKMHTSSRDVSSSSRMSIASKSTMSLSMVVMRGTPRLVERAQQQGAQDS